MSKLLFSSLTSKSMRNDAIIHKKQRMTYSYKKYSFMDSHPLREFLKSVARHPTASFLNPESSFLNVILLILIMSCYIIKNNKAMFLKNTPKAPHGDILRKEPIWQY